MSRALWAVAAVIAIFSFVSVGSEAEAVNAPEVGNLWQAAFSKLQQLDKTEVLLRERRQLDLDGALDFGGDILGDLDIVQGVLNCILGPIKDLLNGALTDLIKNLLAAIKDVLGKLIDSVKDILGGIINGLPDLLGDIKGLLTGILDNVIGGLKDILEKLLGGLCGIPC